MLVKGEVACLHCGHVSGDWVGERGTPLTVHGFRRPAAEGIDPSTPLKCARCGGPVFLDNAGMVVSMARLKRIARLRRQLAVYERDDEAA